MRSEVATFLEALHPQLLPHEYIEGRAVHPGTGETQKLYSKEPTAIAEWAAPLNARGYHAWFGVQPRCGMRSGDASITRIVAIPADIDAKLFSADPDPAASALAAIEQCPIRPSITVHSGGGEQVYWILGEPLTVLAEVQVQRYRRLCQQLGRLVTGPETGPDPIHNRERLMRLPGTVNPKYSPPRAAFLRWCDANRLYRAEDLEAWLAEHAPWTIEPEPIYEAPQQQHHVDSTRDAFNDGYDFRGLLLRHGAKPAGTHGGVEHWTRPGKSHGTSGTFNYHLGKLIVFSSDWPPFEPYGPGGKRRAYDAFAVFCLLEHHDDPRAAFEAAREMGYDPQNVRPSRPMPRSKRRATTPLPVPGRRQSVGVVV